jgi:hypothetical protein
MDKAFWWVFSAVSVVDALLWLLGIICLISAPDKLSVLISCDAGVLSISVPNFNTVDRLSIFNRRLSLRASSDSWQQISQWSNGLKTNKPSRERACDAITYGASVPLQDCRSMILQSLLLGSIDSHGESR